MSGLALSSSTSDEQDDRLEQVVEVLLRLRGDVDELVSPPHSSGWRPRCVISVRTRSGCAPSLSILLTATRIGTSAAFAWSIASWVCGITPSSAATTMTAMSVTWAPRARMAVNASWPGVSRKVIGLVADVDLVGADVLGDAAGLAGDDVGLADRVEQRRLAVVDVAHDRDDRRALDEVLVGVLELGLVVDVVGRVDDLDLLVELVGEDLDRVVGQRLGERGHLAQLHQLLDDLGDRHAEVLGDVLDRRAGVDADRVGLRAAGLVLRRPARRRRHGAGGHRGAAGGAAGPGGPPPGPPWRREACESMTTRRTPPPAPGARSPCERGARRALGAALVAVGGRVGAGAVGALAAAAAAAFCASSSWSCGRPVSARSAASSSTAEAAALTSMPASASRFSTSAEGMSYCLASSWTRFLAMCG